MSLFYILLITVIIVLLGSLLLILPDKNRKNKRLKQNQSYTENRTEKEKSNRVQPLTPPEREEMLEGVKNFTKNNPEKTADVLRKWIDDRSIK